MNAREVALKIVNDVHAGGAYANVALARELEKQAVSDQDRRFITELAYGTVKAGETLDWILNRYMSRPLNKVAPIVRDILRLGAYQLFFMTKTPPSAACNQAVELTKTYGHAGTVKFVNAVLRNAARNPEKAEYPAGREREAEHLALDAWHPLWLVKRWIRQFGSEGARKLCAFDNESPALSVRANTLKISREALAELLTKQGIEFALSDWTPEGIICFTHPAMHRFDALQDGLMQVQDESSMLAAHALDPKPGEFIIDACAAPGGKTTHIAALMQNRGRIAAADIYEHKLERIRENAARLGAEIIQTELTDATTIGRRYPQQADRVLVDAPCSGLGVLRRKPDARWKKDERQLRELPALQLQILTSAADAVKPGGVLVYSTCTIEEAENEAVVRAFLSDRADFALEDAGAKMPCKKKAGAMITMLPHVDGADGFFIARMRRKRVNA